LLECARDVGIVRRRGLFEIVEIRMAEIRRARIYFQDECPRIGSGWRVVDVWEGEKWAHLATDTGRRSRIRLEELDRLEAGTERMLGA
jgi:hypothetical protein